jgi:two-component system, NtrC family, nitrogen regulation sensor histidine kinase NtrY
LNNALYAVQTRAEGDVRIVVSRETDCVRIEIMDNGIGIDKSLKDRIFQPNFTTRSGGSGLGLAIVQNILQNAGGSISLASTSEQGTVFAIVLPSFPE